ncbi:MAG: NAD(P)-binding domain-containing protein, partial [Candidatus Bathyarchaeia archaeon]
MCIHEDFRVLSESSIAIIGGTGKIGRILVKLLQDSGGKIFICSRNLRKAEKIARKLNVESGELNIIKTVDIVFISVPIENIVETAALTIEKM